MEKSNPSPASALSGQHGTPTSDAALLAQIAGGDQAAFTEFYDRLSPALFSLVLRILNDAAEAEDALQEGFLQIWKQAARFDASRSNAFTWSVMIVRSRAIDRLRSRMRHLRKIEAAALESPTQADPAVRNDDDVFLHETRENVRTALDQISPEQKQAIEMAFFVGLTQNEISEQLQQPLGTIKARIRRGLLKLHDCLQGRR